VSRDSLDFRIFYHVPQFDDATIRRMLGHYQTLLEGIVANPDGRLSELPLLTEAERRQFAEWNRTEVPYPKDRCLHQLFEEQVERTPNATAVVFEDRQLTYRQLNERANQLARYLQKLGVGPDALVAICVERSLEMVVGLLGVLKAGGAYVPLDPTYPRERLDYMLRDSGALLLLTQERLRGQFDMGSLNSRILCVDADQETFFGSLNEIPTRVAGPENLAYVIYTSGSTGEPKGVEIRHRNLVNVLSAMARELGFAQKDKLLAVTTISFDIAGLELFLPLITGGQVEVAPTSELRDGFALHQRVERSGATVMQATPATWAMLIEAGWTGNRSLRALCGGEAVTSTLAEGLVKRAREVWNVYGPTETTIWSSLDRIRTGHPITIGRPIANTQFYAVDKQGQPVPIGVPGELLIGGDGLARGYFRRPELTAERFVANRFVSEPAARLYKTGDLVRRLADGTIEWLGRLDHQVKIRGFRIELGEIESVLATHPAVREAVVRAREDAPGDARLVAYLTMKEGAAPKDSDLRGMLRAKLPDYMVPSAFVVMERFSLTPSGKVDRKALPRPDVQSSPEEFAPPETETQRALASVWREVLGIERVGLHDNFFDLGGHSLMALRAIANINKTLKSSLTVPEFFLNPTVKGIAQVLEREPSGQVGAPVAMVLLQEKGDGVPLFCICGIELYRPLARALGEERPVYGIYVEGERVFLEETAADISIRELAHGYAQAILRAQSKGPYQLAGVSFGGVLALETARILEVSGHEVAIVAMIDTIRRDGRRIDLVAYAVGKARKLVTVGPSNMLANLYRRIARKDIDPAERRAKAVHDQARDVRCPVLLIKAAERGMWGDGYVFAEDYGWSAALGRPVQVTEVSGDHLGILNPPQVQELARRLRAELIAV
jgi:amino acid adenylation domain-containing protein